MPVPVHREGVHRIVLQIFEDAASVGTGEQAVARLHDERLCLVFGGAADTASGADHAFHEIRVELSCLQKRHGLPAFIPAGTGHQADSGRILSHLFHGLHNGFRDAAAAGEALGYAPLVRLSKGEKNGSERAHHVIMADCYEAIIGAIYLDKGYDAAEKFIHKNSLDFI